MFWAEIWKISDFFLSEKFSFLVVKCPIYLTRCVFVMSLKWVKILYASESSYILYVLTLVDSFYTIIMIPRFLSLVGLQVKILIGQNHSTSQPSLYNHSIQRQNSLLWWFDWHETFAQEVTINQKCKRTLYLMLQETYVSDICWNRLNEMILKISKLTFYEEIRRKKSLSYISFCSLRILYNSKFILMPTSFGTNAVVVTRVNCIGKKNPVLWHIQTFF